MKQQPGMGQREATHARCISCADPVTRVSARARNPPNASRLGAKNGCNEQPNESEAQRSCDSSSCGPQQTPRKMDELRAAKDLEAVARGGFELVPTDWASERFAFLVRQLSPTRLLVCHFEVCNQAARPNSIDIRPKPAIGSDLTCSNSSSHKIRVMAAACAQARCGLNQLNWVWH